MPRKYIIVSNRLPFAWDERKQQFEKGSGGLVTAVAGIKQDGLHWFGYLPSNSSKHLKQLNHGSSPSFHPVHIPDDVYQLYYDGYCNQVLWPLFHYELDKCHYHNDYWQAYYDTNQQFCDSLAKIVQLGDIVWIHDYQLFLLPKLLRRKVKGCLIGFFLHIPFPSSEIFQQLPNRKVILSGLLASDLIGFHDYNYLRHFSSSVTRLLDIDNNGFYIDHKNFRTELGVFPASVDSTKIIRQAKKITKQATDKFTFLGVDRIDYIKGIDLRLDAFDQLLSQHPQLRGKVILYQVAVPTRSNIAEYQQLKQLVDEKVGRINGQYATSDWSPVHYITKNLPKKELTNLYKNADAMLITSRRDGFNLVALEYILSQDKHDPGVLLLSEFAGAFSQLMQCLPLNPWFPDDIIEKMLLAIDMPIAERRRRWQQMYHYAKSYTAQNWSNSFFSKLTHCQQQHAECLNTIKPTKRSMRHLLKAHAWHKEQRLTLFLDYDGTLTPIVANPSQAHFSDKLGKLLIKLKQQGIEIVIVSGRMRKFLGQQFKDYPFPLVAEHGAFLFDPKRRKWRDQIKESREWYKIAQVIMNKYAELLPGAFVEKKTYSIAWHYRSSPTYSANFQAYKLFEELKLSLNKLPVSVNRGHKIIEVKHIHANKGDGIQYFLDQYREADNFYIAMGDDLTDEDMFTRVKSKGIAAKVGDGASSADVRLQQQKDVVKFLSCLDDL